jgi:hypothetical protein
MISKQNWWELGITHKDGSTQTMESFDTLNQAIQALKQYPDNTAFIDQWAYFDRSFPEPYGITYNKITLANVPQ